MTGPVESVPMPEAAALPQEIARGWTGTWSPIRRSPGYHLALVLTAFAMILLVAAYVALLTTVVGATCWHAWSHTGWIRGARGPVALSAALAAYVIPILVGIGVLFCLVKPVFAPRPDREPYFSIEPFEEQTLFAFVDSVCAAMGAPTPRRIDVIGEPNASAHFRRGVLSLFSRGDMVLTIGMPLATGMSVKQLAGVLAHEFGHFSQGGAMRASYLIQSINAWLYRVSCVPDGWDVLMYVASRTSENGLLRLTLRLVLIASSIARGVLRLFLLFGHAVSCAMMRRMEYDADRHEARMVGAAAFASTCRRLAELSASSAAMPEELREHVKLRELPDDLPALIAARPLSAEDRRTVEDLLTTDEGKLFDTHPTIPRRLAAVAAAAEPGVFHPEGPASVLFRNFADACRKATYAQFRIMLGPELERATFISVADRVKQLRSDGRVRAAVRAYIGCVPPSWDPLQIALREATGTDDTKAAWRAIKEAGATIESLKGAGEAAARAVESAHAVLAEGERGQALFDLGYAVAPDELELKQPTPGSVEVARERALGEIMRHAETVESLLEAGSRRCSAALRLLHTRGCELKIANAARLRRRSAELLAAHTALREAIPAAKSLRARAAGFEALVDASMLEAHEKRLKPGLREHATRLRDALDEFRRPLGAVRYPYADASESMNLGEKIVADLPDDRSFEDLALAGRLAARRFPEVYERVTAELVAVAATVERALEPARVTASGRSGPDRGTMAE
ncbi:MAG: M48 family metalloprotease [Phycisphaerae bacterium]|nr:M48 family metalloprotease [Phycisphaerae bacterium]